MKMRTLGRTGVKYLWARAYHIPPETTTEESGYFTLLRVDPTQG